ncbi:hypothetical protein PENTCL1PPCAC_20134, partial [Pristionchus entomophagus]
MTTRSTCGISEWRGSSCTRTERARDVVPFRGTIKYATRTSHIRQEQSRRDDIEGWCYMIMEYFNKENLRWRRLTDREQILAEKRKVMSKYRKLDPPLFVPESLYGVFDLIGAMGYDWKPDYAAIHRTLDEMSKEENIDESLPLDWIGKAMDPTTPKRKMRPDEKLLDERDARDRRRWAEREERERKFQKKLKKLYKGSNKTPDEIRAEVMEMARKLEEDNKEGGEELPDVAEEDGTGPEEPKGEGVTLDPCSVAGSISRCSHFCLTGN